MRLRAVWLAGLLLGIHVVDAHQVTPSAYRAAAARAGVPDSILFALALQESGVVLHGRLVPWPWSLNISGEAHRYWTRQDACIALRRALRANPGGLVDVGLGQISIGYHRDRVPQPCDLLDPYRNLDVTATILYEQHVPGEDWSIAIGRYHRPAGGPPAARYEISVRRHLTRLLGTQRAQATLRGGTP